MYLNFSELIFAGLKVFAKALYLSYRDKHFNETVVGRYIVKDYSFTKFNVNQQLWQCVKEMICYSL